MSSLDDFLNDGKLTPTVKSDTKLTTYKPKPEPTPIDQTIFKDLKLSEAWIKVMKGIYF